MDTLLYAAVLWVICAILAAVIAVHRDEDATHAFLFGLIAGPVGLYMVARDH